MRLIADGGEIERRKIERPIDILTFVMAGNAIFTLEYPSKRFTYRVELSDDKKVSFISVLSGPNNTRDYSYLGIIRGTEFSLTAKSTAGKDAPSVVAFAWFWRALIRKDDESLAKLSFFHEGRCGRCGRTLTVPESIERGIGPDCAQIMGMAA